MQSIPHARTLREIAACLNRSKGSVSSWIAKKDPPEKHPVKGYNMARWVEWVLDNVNFKQGSEVPTKEMAFARAREMGLPEYDEEVDEPNPGNTIELGEQELINIERMRAEVEQKKAKAALDSMKAAEKRGELVPITELRAIVRGVQSVYNRTLDNLARSLPTDLQHRPAEEIEAILLSEHRVLREDAARMAKEEP